MSKAQVYTASMRFCNKHKEQWRTGGGIGIMKKPYRPDGHSKILSTASNLVQNSSSVDPTER